MICAVLLAICLAVSAVSADDEWSFNWSSSESSNSDGGEMSFENGKLKLQGIEFNIPDGFKENETTPSSKPTGIATIKPKITLPINGLIYGKILFSNQLYSNDVSACESFNFISTYY